MGFGVWDLRHCICIEISRQIQVSTHPNKFSEAIFEHFPMVFQCFFTIFGMDRWTHGRTDGRSDGRTVGRSDGRTDGRADGRPDCRMAVGWAVRRMDGRPVGRTDGWTDGWKP